MDEIKSGKLINSERGSIFVTSIFTSREQAMYCGYSDTFFSTNLNCDCMSIALEGNRREFALCYNSEKEMPPEVRRLYRFSENFCKNDMVSALNIPSGLLKANLGKYVTYTNTKGDSVIYRIREKYDADKKSVCYRLDKVYKERLNPPLELKGRYHITEEKEIFRYLNRGVREQGER